MRSAHFEDTINLSHYLHLNEDGWAVKAVALYRLINALLDAKVDCDFSVGY